VAILALAALQHILQQLAHTLKFVNLILSMRVAMDVPVPLAG
jgi:hypothetical protein